MSSPIPNAKVVLVAVAGGETDAFWSALRPLLPQSMSVHLIHVTDEGPRHELELQRLRRPGRGPAAPPGGSLPPDQERRLRKAESMGEQAILAEAGSAIGGDPATTALRGRPEREIVAHAPKIGAAMLAVGARAHESPTTVGPHSFGHVARYVVDHAPCPVLLIRIGGAPGEARRSPGQLK